MNRDDTPSRLPALALSLLLAMTALPSVDADLLDDTPDLGVAIPMANEDTTPPTITGISSPNRQIPSLFYAFGNAYLRVTAQDETGGSGVAGFSVANIPTGATTEPDCTIDFAATDGVNHISQLVGLFFDGSVKVRAIDHAGNCSDSSSIIIRSDTIRPEYTSTSPAKGESVEATHNTIIIDYEDVDLYKGKEHDENEVLTQVHVPSIQFFVDGVDRSDSIIATANRLTYESLGFTPGEHQVKVGIRDTAEKSQFTFLEFTFHVVGGGRTDQDADGIPDALEPALCDAELDSIPHDGTCSGEDYTMPYDADAYELISYGLSGVARTINSVTGEYVPVQYNLQLN